ncbi:MAG TPA: hypothetical protein VHL59_09935 [Thermoanaerobaculia bacterium]|nr:hypothetical protein [Thermoanaerobaculia bacterium]
MHILRSIAVVALLCGAAADAVAAPVSEFYLTMLARGISEYNAGRYEAAMSPLRIAAFGLIDATDKYQTAHVYLSLAADKTGDTAVSRDSAQRVVAAERLTRTYATLDLPAAMRSGFDAVAKKVLAPADVAFLSTPPPTRAAEKAAGPTAETTAAPPKKAPAEGKTPESKEPPKETAPPTAGKPNAQRVASKPQPQQPPPAAPVRITAPAAAPAPKPRDVRAELTAAERALTSGKLADAQKIYHGLLADTTIAHQDLLRVAEGLYRSRDFPGVLRAFERAGALRNGEEIYRYYRAVAFYETAQYAAAKTELAAVLPYIQETADVARYRAKIEAAR